MQQQTLRAPAEGTAAVDSLASPNVSPFLLCTGSPGQGGGRYRLSSQAREAMIDCQDLQASETFGWEMDGAEAQHGYFRNIPLDPLICRAAVQFFGFRSELVLHKAKQQVWPCWQRWQVAILAPGAGHQLADRRRPPEHMSPTQVRRGRTGSGNRHRTMTAPSSGAKRRARTASLHGLI